MSDSQDNEGARRIAGLTATYNTDGNNPINTGDEIYASLFPSMHYNSKDPNDVTPGVLFNPSGNPGGEVMKYVARTVAHSWIETETMFKTIRQSLRLDYLFNPVTFWSGLDNFIENSLKIPDKVSQLYDFARITGAYIVWKHNPRDATAKKNLMDTLNKYYLAQTRIASQYQREMQMNPMGKIAQAHPVFKGASGQDAGQLFNVGMFDEKQFCELCESVQDMQWECFAGYMNYLQRLYMGTALAPAPCGETLYFLQKKR